MKSQITYTALGFIILAGIYKLQNRDMIHLDNSTIIMVAVVLTYIVVFAFYMINKLNRKRMKTLGSSATIAGIEKLINEYFFSTTYKVDPETLEVSNSVGSRPDLIVELRDNRYYFKRK